MLTATMDISLRVAIGFVILLILVRLIGNKQLGQLNVFTYISGIVIGSMVADIILHDDIALWPSMFGVALWTGLAFCVELMALKNVKVRELLDGQPIILIKKGQIHYAALKKERMNIDDLTMMLRTNSVFAVADVDYAILEPNGDLSVLPKQNKQNLVKEDLNITQVKPKYFPTTLIIDGKVLAKNLKELGLSEDWLRDTLSESGVQNAADVLYAEIQEDGQLHVQRN